MAERTMAMEQSKKSLVVSPRPERFLRPAIPNQSRLPFENNLVTDQLFESNAHRETEARLKHLVELRGLLLDRVLASGKISP